MEFVLSDVGKDADVHAFWAGWVGRREGTTLSSGICLTLWWLLCGSLGSSSNVRVRDPRLEQLLLPPDELTFQAPCRED